MNPSDPLKIAHIHAAIQDSGRSLPDQAMRCITRHTTRKTWRVSLPRAIDGGQHYFSDSDHGGTEYALIEAQYFRDAAFTKLGLDIYARTNITKRRQELGKSTLPIIEMFDQRTKKQTVVGWWKSTETGQTKLIKILRQINPRTREDAWKEVEEIVREGIAIEAKRRRTLAKSPHPKN